MKPQEKNLRDVRDILIGLLEEVDEDLEQLDESNPEFDSKLSLAKNYLDDLEEKPKDYENLVDMALVA